MALTLNLTPLTTRAACDAVLTSLAAELDAYQHRGGNFDFADRQATRAEAGRTGRLADVQADITIYTTLLAAPTLTARKRKELEILLRKANDRKDNLGDAASTRSADAQVLAEVDDAQNDAQLAVLQEATALVTAHKATLPA